MTTEELLAFKENVREDLRIHKIPTFAFPSDPEEDDDETIAENEELRVGISCICALLVCRLNRNRT